MTKKEFSQIMVSNDTKYTLSILKKGRSFNEICKAMADYFIFTKYDPFAISNNPTLDNRKDMELIIRIQKAQEKDLFRPILDAVMKLSNNIENHTRLNENVTDEEIQIIVENNAKLEEEVRMLTLENERLLEEKMKTRTIDESKLINSNAIKKDTIVQLVSFLKKSAKRNHFAPELYEIERKALDGFCEKLLEELHLK